MKTKLNKSLILERLKEIKGFKTDTELAVFLGITRSTLSNWHNRNSIDFDILFSKCEHINIDWLITGEGEMLKEVEEINSLMPKEPSYPIGVMGKPIYLYDVSASAGFGSFDEMISQEKVIGQYIIPDFKNVDWMITVKGSSMYPKYSSGDIIACRELRESKFIQWGKVYVVATREQGLLVKRLEEDGDDFLLAISDNQAYKPFKIPKNEVMGIALVVGVIRLE